MGCIQSHKDVNDAHPDQFYVINIDECGNGLWAGYFEVTDSELILFRQGKEPTRWPLRSLRRYGFDAEIFSFESGRRCATGEGIYAFKCRRAEQLFNNLQQCIQNKNHNNENVLDNLSFENPTCPPGTLPRPLPDTLQLVPNSNQTEYLEPTPTAGFISTSRFSGLRLGSTGSGPLSPEVHSPGSPSSTNILEVMPLAPLPSGGPQVTNLYQFQDFPLQKENNNNKKVKLDTSNHSYLNTGDVNTDLATLRHVLQSQQRNANEEDSCHATLNYINEPLNQNNNIVPLSPTLSTTSEHYATLAVSRNANNRLYMNVGEMSLVLPSIHEELNSNSKTNIQAIDTPKLSNFNFIDTDIEEEIHNYANIGPGDINFDPRRFSCQNNKLLRGSLMDSQVEAASKINYAVLDLDKSDDNVCDDTQTLPPSSPKKPAIGYTIIDINKTKALTSVALGTEVDTEGSRKTRHNSTALPSSPTIT